MGKNERQPASPDEIRRANLTFIGFLAISVIMIQDFVSSGVTDASAIISVLAFAVAIPCLSVSVYILNTPFAPRFFVTRPYNYFIILALISTIVGLAAAFWHILWIAALVFLASSVLAFIVFTKAEGQYKE